jgi:Fibronectin type III domain
MLLAYEITCRYGLWLAVLAVSGCMHAQPQAEDDPTQYDAPTLYAPDGPTQTSSTVTAPQWIADHYIGSTSQGHQHVGNTIETMQAACLAHFPKAQTNTSQTSGKAVHICKNPRYFLTVTYAPNSQVNCEVSGWGQWAPVQCYAPEQQTRTRTVSVLPEGGGAGCPALSETRLCDLPPAQQSWTRAGREGETITPPAEGSYRYGCDDADDAGCPAGDVWSAARVFSAPFGCNNTTFGDPIEGVEKTCQVSSVAPNAPPNSGTASLQWQAPTANVDGSALTNLAGFRIYYGTETEPHRWQIDIGSPSTTRYTVTNLMGGVRYVFAVRALNTAGAESSDSNVATKQMP